MKQCKLLIIWLLLGSLSVGCRNTADSDIGRQAVELMYTFDDLSELALNQKKLKRLMAEEVYNELTIDKEGRQLFSYLKFQGAPCKVQILSSTDDHVIFRLQNANVDDGRLFIFFYKVSSGKISYVREVECIDFVDISDFSN